jgi:thioredoxin 1
MTTILNDENFDKEITGTDKFVLVDFFATWCEPCSVLAPILEKVAADLKDKIVLQKVNIDDSPKTAEKFGIEKIPTVVLFKNGAPVSGFVGMVPEESIKEWLENAFKNPLPTPVVEKKEVEPDTNGMIERYDNYAKSNGFRLNPNRKIVEGIINGLFQNEKKYGKKYCPCRRVKGNEAEDAKIICPCVFHKDEIQKDGHCLCNLFLK